eukprot:10774705-Lingulodinium_polyedra.AAC.1
MSGPVAGQWPWPHHCNVRAARSILLWSSFFCEFVTAPRRCHELEDHVPRGVRELRNAQRRADR